MAWESLGKAYLELLTTVVGIINDKLRAFEEMDRYNTSSYR